ncbi:bifunctional folylpolyglutamate synthase/dihydrofolate synthase [Lachnospiraceae bacterium DSM 108991]|uniref:tetrahydrofolate synthase n=1 Tax=Claveliimonas monacensis TaxID=2779351 RepID=A0ABR9RHJ7_9FIRM|nr:MULTISPECIES: folylpolyglutamate synthase/dihydrofolate synthase family protein [Lachnospiraceae]MBE5062437.1 bifunctional folylpolyglutamate synthase/dihydrofolate synthase [Claveliimonas monacensis]
MTYQEAVAYIEEIPKFTEKHSLAYIRDFLKRMGNPGMDRKIIHVAGTNGKGSVCAYMQAVLLEMGRRTGFFTSPHLISINERIVVDREQIDDAEFLAVFEQVKETVDGMAADGVSHPSYFEFLFGMAMLAFAQADVEYIILETGLGGRLDATNAVEHPAVAVITSISLDHTAYLGDTVEQIAAEKAGIIKEGVPVIFDGTDPGAAAVIEARAKALHADCRKLGKNAFEIREITRKHIAFSRGSAYDKDELWTIRGCGTYQMMNVSLALAALETVLPEEYVDYERWKKAVSRVVWKGRMEEIRPGIFLDGAHNPGAVEAFADTLDALGERGPVILFSAVSDKEYEKMVSILCGRVKTGLYIVTEIKDSRKVPARELGEIFRRYTDSQVLVCREPAEALQEALARRHDRCICCLGSLYLIGELRRLFEENAACT